MSVEQIEVNMISNPADQQKLLGVLRECSDAKTRIASERDYIKEAVSAICDDLQLPKKLVNKMVKVYYNQNFNQEVAEQDLFETFYETIVK